MRYLFTGWYCSLLLREDGYINLCQNRLKTQVFQGKFLFSLKTGIYACRTVDLYLPVLLFLLHYPQSFYAEKKINFIILYALTNEVLRH